MLKKDGTPFTFLIVDDSRFARQQLIRSLPAGLAHNLSVASHGEEALSLLRQGLGQDLDAIAQATEDFDFESALQQLRTAALAHGIALEEQRA